TLRGGFKMHVTAQISMNWVDFFIISPALALFIASLIPLLMKVFMGNREPNSVVPYGFAMVGVFGALALTVGNWGISRTAFDGAIVFDQLSTIGSLIILATTGVGLTLLRESPSVQRRQFTE